MQLRGNGLFLCSNAVTLEHPFYNSQAGKKEFNKRKLERRIGNDVWVRDDGVVMVSARIDLPEKFRSFISREDDRFDRLAEEPNT